MKISRDRRIATGAALFGFGFLYFLTTCAFLLTLYFQKLLIDMAADSGPRIGAFSVALMIAALVAIQMGPVFWIGNYMTGQKTFAMYGRIIDCMIARGLSMPTADYDAMDRGFVLNLLLQDGVETAKKRLSETSLLFGIGLHIAVVVAWIAWLDPMLTLLALGCIPPYLGFAALASSVIKRRVKSAAEAGDVKMRYFSNVTRHLAQIRLFGANARVERGFSETLDAQYRHFFRLERTRAMMQAPDRILTTLLPMAVLWLGRELVGRGSMTIGTLVLFSQVAGYLFEPVHNFAIQLQTIRSAKPYQDRIERFLYGESDTEAAYGRQFGRTDRFALGYTELSAPDGRLLYAGEIDLPPRGFWIVKGANGTGKSTLLRAISGAARPDQMRAEGKMPEEVRGRIGMMRYPLYFFEGTVRENILRHPPEDLCAALDLPPLDKVVTVSPLNLSSGEAQKVALARALSADDLVCLLDEPTTNLEEAAIQRFGEYLRKISAQKLILAIMHEPIYDPLADGVIHIADGRVWVESKDAGAQALHS